MEQFIGCDADKKFSSIRVGERKRQAVVGGREFTGAEATLEDDGQRSSEVAIARRTSKA